jgi:hypothetical protein
MWDFNLAKAIGVMVQTWPFIVFRMAVYFGIGLAYVFSVGAGAGTGWVLNYLTADPQDAGSFTAWGGLAGFSFVSAALYWFREYILYLVKAGHIAVMVELLDGKSIPGGRSQIDYAQGVVRERFLQSSVLFGVDQLVKGVIGVITGTVSRRADFGLFDPDADGQSLGGRARRVGVVCAELLVVREERGVDHHRHVCHHHSGLCPRRRPRLGVGGLSARRLVGMGTRDCSDLRVRVQGRFSGTIGHRLPHASVFQEDRGAIARSRMACAIEPFVRQVPTDEG